MNRALNTIGIGRAAHTTTNEWKASEDKNQNIIEGERGTVTIKHHSPERKFEQNTWWDTDERYVANNR